MTTLDPLEKLEQSIKQIHTEMQNRTNPLQNKYPVLFALLFTFGAAAVIHSFERLADDIELFAKHPVLLMMLGISILIFTGSLYKAFNQK